MSTEKKPTATVKASFNSKAAGEAHKAEPVKEADKKISEKKPAAVKAAAKTPEKTAAPAREAKAKTEDTKVLVKKEEKKVEKKVEKKAEEKKTAPVKAAEKKAAPVKAAAEKKAAPAEKAAEKKAAPAAKKPAEKKAAPAKKEAAPAAKTEAEVILQWNGNDYTYDRLLQSAKDVWQYDQGKNVADFKKAAIYVKPEEGKAYVVVNDKDELSFDI